MSHGSKMSRHLDYIWPEFSSKVDVWGLFLIQYILNISIFNGNITLFSLHEITLCSRHCYHGSEQLPIQSDTTLATLSLSSLIFCHFSSNFGHLLV